jgi:hypothetical protein
MQTCTVCGLWYPSAGSDRLDLCMDCWQANFAGAQPSPTPHTPTREALHAYVDAAGPYTLTPRQAEAMSQLVAAWRREVEDAR